MFNIVLFNPQIPQNTGNIARTCAVTNSRLHLIKPYGFTINDKTLKRAGLDYWDDLDVLEYDNFDDFITKNPDARIFPVTTRGQAKYSDKEYLDGDYFLFGSETSGLPDYVHEKLYDNRIRIPMRKGERCLNLSNSVAIIVYEAIKQTDFKDFI